MLRLSCQFDEVAFNVSRIFKKLSYINKFWERLKGCKLGVSDHCIYLKRIGVWGYSVFSVCLISGAKPLLILITSLCFWKIATLFKGAGIYILHVTLT